ncbi:protein-lysine N-methyltransferase SMYD4 [Halictus rubicundus]|uniref:protein-lysine N-methyltransferase SMYD4 n=1 Tax=Halictus rubicundus TaxID=77578 RepID=UPI004036DB95
MFAAKGCTKFHEFFKVAYDGGISEPFAARFKESSAKGDREGMIKVLMGMPCVKNMKVAESYRGKDDVKAAEIYCKIRGTNVENGEQESRINALAETLFMASVTSRLFLEVLFDCAQSCYDSRAFASCLGYCECMLALPASFYDKTVESMNDFFERRKACVHLESECSKILKRSSSRGKGTSRTARSNERVLPKTPAVDGKPNSLLQSTSDAVALDVDEKRGRRLVATRNIKAGTVLIVGSPFAYTTNRDALETNCLHCHASLKPTGSVKIPCRSCRAVSFCSERCRKEAWQAYHRFECLILDAFYEARSEDTQTQVSHLLLAYRMTVAGSLSPKRRTVDNDDKADDDKIPFLDDDHVRRYAAAAKEYRNRLGRSEIYQSQDYRTVLALETHCAALDHHVNLIRGIEAIFLTKCFTFVLSKMDVVCLEDAFLWLAVGMMHHLQAINCNAYEIVENVYNKETHVWEPREIGGAIYPTVSLVNHSCYPNVVRHSYVAGTVVVRTLRFIGKGSEILDCYGPHFLEESRLQRREHLSKKYRFLCDCEACAGNWQFPLPETIAYKCRTCSEPVGSFSLNGNVDKDDRRVSTNVAQRCKCNEKKLDRKKLYAQFRKSVDRRLNAISKMYEGQYTQALPQLIEHINFIEKFFVAPNSETIKTQQCIIQCYNRFGCTSQ